MTYKEILAVCERVAKELGVICETKDFADYGWRFIGVMTDKFGGICVCLCYINDSTLNNSGHKSGECYNDINSAREVKIESAEQLEHLIRESVADMKANRDLRAICDQVNAENQE